MDRQVPLGSTELALDELVDARQMRSVIAAALATTPVDGESLRRGVYSYVGAERKLGTSAGRVIVALTDLVECSSIVPTSIQQAVTRRVILWCVDAYFGRLGGEFVAACDVRSLAVSASDPAMSLADR